MNQSSTLNYKGQDITQSIAFTDLIIFIRFSITLRSCCTIFITKIISLFFVEDFIKIATLINADWELTFCSRYLEISFRDNTQKCDTINFLIMSSHRIKEISMGKWAASCYSFWSVVFFHFTGTLSCQHYIQQICFYLKEYKQIEESSL